MFFAKNQYGTERLKQAFDALPTAPDKRMHETAKYLAVSERTLSRWLTGKATPPRAAVYALWLESPLGLAETSAHSERAAYLWRSLAKSQEQTIVSLRLALAELNDELSSINEALRSE